MDVTGCGRHGIPRGGMQMERRHASRRQVSVEYPYRVGGIKIHSLYSGTTGRTLGGPYESRESRRIGGAGTRVACGRTDGIQLSFASLRAVGAISRSNSPGTPSASTCKRGMTLKLPMRTSSRIRITSYEWESIFMIRYVVPESCTMPLHCICRLRWAAGSFA